MGRIEQHGCCCDAPSVSDGFPDKIPLSFQFATDVVADARRGSIDDHEPVGIDQFGDHLAQAAQSNNNQTRLVDPALGAVVVGQVNSRPQDARAESQESEVSRRSMCSRRPCSISNPLVCKSHNMVRLPNLMTQLGRGHFVRFNAMNRNRSLSLNPQPHTAAANGDHCQHDLLILANRDSLSDLLGEDQHRSAYLH